MFAVALFASYLLGSIPFGYIAGRIAGIDIRNVGSRNLGATNVTRTLGKAYGYSVFTLDFLKGLAAVRLSIVIAERAPGMSVSPEITGMVAAIFCVIGHSFPIWLRFKGGKGVATSAGALFGLMPAALVIGAIVWIVTFQITRFVSLASMVAAIALPMATLILLLLGHATSYALFYFTIGLAGLIIVRHRANLSRLIRGTEPRFTRK
ncbi:MAG: glycerol-3-phosphate 1-O-acyltransferase PlsY [Chthoniobacterales bacterium]